MRDDPEFNALFVSMIKKNECLYDYTSRDYADRVKQDLAWEKLSKELNETAATCKERWKNIRACYTRHLLKMKDDTTTKYKRPYYLADQLSFLLPFTKSRKQLANVKLQCSQSSKPNVSLDEHEGSTDDDSDTNYEKEAEYEDREISDSLVSNSLSFDSTPHITKKAKIITNKSKKNSHASNNGANKVGYHIIQRKQQIQMGDLEDDADMNFFKSLLPDMKSMSPAQKRQYKIEILQLTHSILSEPHSMSHQSSSTSYFIHCQNQDGPMSPASDLPQSKAWHTPQN